VTPRTCQFVADLILLVHAAFVAFVVFGQVLIVLGVPGKWRWVRNFRFRLAHLLAIGFVVLEAWWGVDCPLTVWEHELRVRAGGDGYAGSFVEHWVQRIIFFEAPGWVFVLVYTVFAGAVVLTWFLAPPRRRRGAR